MKIIGYKKFKKKGMLKKSELRRTELSILNTDVKFISDIEKNQFKIIFRNDLKFGVKEITFGQIKSKGVEFYLESTTEFEHERLKGLIK